MLVFAAFLASGCYADTGYDVYPQGKLVQSASLVREWAGGEAKLNLGADEAFSADQLTLEYFECSSDGVRALLTC